jgi:hypothetical protein
LYYAGWWHLQLASLSVRFIGISSSTYKCLNLFQGVINEYASLFFTSIVARIVNDESAECRQMAAAAVKLLLGKV